MIINAGRLIGFIYQAAKLVFPKKFISRVVVMGILVRSIPSNSSISSISIPSIPIHLSSFNTHLTPQRSGTIEGHHPWSIFIEKIWRFFEDGFYDVDEGNSHARRTILPEWRIHLSLPFFNILLFSFAWYFLQSSLLCVPFYSFFPTPIRPSLAYSRLFFTFTRHGPALPLCK